MPTSQISVLFLPKTSTVHIIMLNVIEREDRVSLRSGEGKRSENRERGGGEREREKEKNLRLNTAPFPSTKQICKTCILSHQLIKIAVWSPN